jgi:hypothetical protein
VSTGKLLAHLVDAHGVRQTTLSAVAVERIGIRPLTYRVTWSDPTDLECPHVTSAWIGRRLADLTSIERWHVMIEDNGAGAYQARAVAQEEPRAEDRA